MRLLSGHTYYGHYVCVLFSHLQSGYIDKQGYLLIWINQKRTNSIISNLLKQNRGDKGYGDSGYTFKFNDHTLTALDTTNDACDSIKNATSNQNALADLANYRLVLKKNSPTILLPPS